MEWYYALLFLLASTTTLFICLVIITRRAAPGAGSLAVYCGAMTVWTMMYAFSFLSTTAPWSLFWLKCTYLGVLAAPPAFLVFAMNYTGRVARLSRRLLGLLAIEPLIILGLLWLKPQASQWTSLHLDWSVLGGGVGFWINLVYSYLLILVAAVIIVQATWRNSPGLRNQALAVILGSFIPWLANLIGLLHLNPFPNLDLTPIAFTLTSVCFGVGLFYYHLFDISPIARAAIIESLVDGVIVVDEQRRILDINPAARKLLNWEGQQIIGVPLQTAFPDYEPQLDRSHALGAFEQEITLGDPPTTYLNVWDSPLPTRGNRDGGRMIVVRDTTESRLAQQEERELRTLAEALRDTAAALNSSHTFEEVLDRLLVNVGRVVPHDLANFILVDDHGIARVARTRGYREHRMKNYLDHVDIPVESVPNFRRMIETGQAIFVPDTRRNQDWVQFKDAARIRSYVGAPVKVKGIIVGFLDLISLKPDYFNQEHADRLQAFADQVAVAIENARLFEETQRGASQMAALLDIGLKMTSSLDLRQILKTLLKKCMEILPVEVFYVATFDREAGLIQHPLFFDMGKHRKIPLHDITKDPGLSGYVIRTRQTLYLPDLNIPEAVEKYGLIRTGGMPTRSYLGVPLIVGDNVIGVISIQSYKQNAYQPNQIHLLQTIATQAAGLIENSRLYRKAQDELVQRKEAEHRYHALFEQSHDAVFIIDFNGRNIEANHRASEMLGYTVEEILSRSVNDVSVQQEESEVARQRLLNGEHIPSYERKFRTKDGEVITAEINAELVRDTEGRPLHIQSVVRDITERKRSELALQEANKTLRKQLSEIQSLQSQLREQAIRDSLTGLFNRRYLEETLLREFESAKRSASSVCLVMIDIDGFKGFNDHYGHDAGDYLLEQLGKLMQSEVRRSDISCRYGGEEFVVVMPGAPLDRGFERAERLRSAFESSILKHMGVNLKATLSLGVAAFPQHGETWDAVLHAADRAMYAAKAAGKNRVCSAGD